MFDLKFSKLSTISKDNFDYLFEHHHRYFHQIYGENDGLNSAETFPKWKLSIQGNTKNDVKYLVTHLSDFLENEIKCAYKIGTENLIMYQGKREQQKYKLMTIYIPNEYEVTEFAEMVHQRMTDYRGGDDVPPPDSYTHYKGGIYYRCDRDENNNYIIPY